MKLFPKSWELCPADTVCSEIVDCLNKTAPVVEHDTGFRMIRTTNVRHGRVDVEDNRFVEEAVFNKWTRRARPKRNDVILSREAPLGEVGLLRSDAKVFLGQRTMLYRADPKKLDQHYLYYQMVGPYVQAVIQGQGQGSTVAHLRVPDAETLPIPVAPLPAQRKIAAVLAAYDDLIEANRRRIALLERMAEEIYREWFVRLRFPGHAKTKITKGVPSGWAVKKLGEIVTEVKRGIRHRDLSADQRYLGLEHIPRKSIALCEWATADSVDSDKLRFEARDILFSKIRPYLHKVSLAHFPGVCSTDTIVLRPVEHACEGFVLFTVFSETFIELATVASNGTKMPRADWKFLRKLELLVPSHELCESFQAQFEAQFSQIVTLLRANESLQRTRDLLLPRLISGKLPVEDLAIAFPPSMAEAVSA